MIRNKRSRTACAPYSAVQHIADADSLCLEAIKRLRHAGAAKAADAVARARKSVGGAERHARRVMAEEGLKNIGRLHEELAMSKPLSSRPPLRT